jgi:HlyD family secretion protein
MFKSKGRLIALTVLLVALAAVTWLTLQEKGLPAEVATVRTTGFEVVIRGEGQTRVRDRYQMTAPVSGELQAISLEAGASVSVGDVLFRIVPGPESVQTQELAQARLQAVRAGLAIRESQLQEASRVAEQAERTLKRQRALAQDGILSPEEWERAQLSAAAARQGLDAAEAARGAAAADVRSAEALALPSEADRAAGGITVRSELDGTILQLPDRSSRMVATGHPVMVLGNLDRMDVVVDVLSEEALRLRPGQDVHFEGWGGADSVTGRVRYVEPAAFTKFSALGVEEQRVNVVIELPGPMAGLGDGFRVETGVVVHQTESALTVPVSAIFRESGSWMVFAVVEGRIQRRRVELGERSSEVVEVIDGLAEGDEVVRYPGAGMDDGVLVSR